MAYIILNCSFNLRFVIIIRLGDRTMKNVYRFVGPINGQDLPLFNRMMANIFSFIDEYGDQKN